MTNQLPASARREDFLLATYGQMWGNVNRHILVVWQSVAALFGAFAVFALIEKKVIPPDFACSLLVMICAWVGAHIIDANYWFARNLVIITNIERMFLSETDVTFVHPYFASHRKPTILDHLEIQGWLAMGVFALVVVWHISTRVAPGLSLPLQYFDPWRALPYVFSALALFLLVRFRKKQRIAYEKLLKESPGLPSLRSPPT